MPTHPFGTSDTLTNFPKKSTIPSNILHQKASFLFVGSIPQSWNLHDCQNLVKQFGSVLNIILQPKKHDIDQNAGFVFYQFENTEDASQAFLHLHGKDVDSQHKLFCKRLQGNTSVYVGNLPRNIPIEKIILKLKSLLPFPILSVDIHKPLIFNVWDDQTQDFHTEKSLNLKDQLNRGYGFITLESPEFAVQAMTILNQSSIHNRPINCRWPDLRYLADPTDKLLKNVKTIWVNNIPQQIRRSNMLMQALFGQFGEITEMKVPYQKTHKEHMQGKKHGAPRSKRHLPADYAFITYKTRAAALEAIRVLHLPNQSFQQFFLNLNIRLSLPHKSKHHVRPSKYPSKVTRNSECQNSPLKPRHKPNLHSHQSNSLSQNQQNQQDLQTVDHPIPNQRDSSYGSFGHSYSTSSSYGPIFSPSPSQSPQPQGYFVNTLQHQGTGSFNQGGAFHHASFHYGDFVRPLSPAGVWTVNPQGYFQNQAQYHHPGTYQLIGSTSSIASNSFPLISSSAPILYPQHNDQREENTENDLINKENSQNEVVQQENIKTSEEIIEKSEPAASEENDDISPKTILGQTQERAVKNEKNHSNKSTKGWKNDLPQTPKKQNTLRNRPNTPISKTQYSSQSVEKSTPFQEKWVHQGITTPGTAPRFGIQIFNQPSGYLRPDSPLPVPLFSSSSVHNASPNGLVQQSHPLYQGYSPYQAMVVYQIPHQQQSQMFPYPPLQNPLTNRFSHKSTKKLPKNL